MNCPAEIQIRTVKVFSNYIVDLKACKSERMVRARKEEVKATLKRDLEKKEKPQFIIRHFVKIPLYSVHKGHPIGDQAGIHEVVDKQINTR